MQQSLHQLGGLVLGEERREENFIVIVIETRLKIMSGIFPGSTKLRKEFVHTRNNRHEKGQRLSDPTHVHENALIAWSQTEEWSTKQGPKERRRERTHLEEHAHQPCKEESDEISGEQKPRSKVVSRSNSAPTPPSANHRKRRNIHISVAEVARREPGPTRECTICTETFTLGSFPKRSPTTTCTHPPSVCRTCLRKWLKTCFETKLWDQLTCPECSTQLKHADVQRCASGKVFKKYDELSIKAAMEAIERFRWCVVERKRWKKSGERDGGGGCGNGQVHGNGAKMEIYRMW